MGSLARRLGQWSRKSLESESASIFKGLKNNKVPGSLSLLLDGTLQEGHDMRIFGAGTLATMASRAKYQQFLTNLHAIYGTLEEELDATSSPAIVRQVIRTVWTPDNAQWLRRSERLQQDLDDLQLLYEEEWDTNRTNPSNLRKSWLIQEFQEARVSPPTLHYLQAIRQAGDADRGNGGGRLLGHLYCRYFADLFGGQMLGRPYELALQLPRSPRHLEFDFGTTSSRQEVLEQLYGDLNQAGKLLTAEQREEVRKESLVAFQHNVNVYSEEPGMMTSAVRGGVNCILGWATSFGN